MIDHDKRAKDIKVEHIGETGFIDWDATLVNIAAYGRAVEREVWEQAAREVENGRFLTNESPEYNFGQKVAMMLRAKAQGA